MDIILERILSLIPKKEDGKFKHGELSKFARKLGFKDGHIVSDWLAKNSTSYLNYLYQISAIYGVSVEWLKGETDDPTPAGQKKPALDFESGLTDPLDIQLMNELPGLTSDQKELLLAQILVLKGKK